MWLGAIRRLLVILGVLAAGTVAVSLVLGALAHANLWRAVGIGFYIAGAAALVGCFVLGSRGPWRGEWGDRDRPNRGVLPRSVRRATPEERSESRLNSLGLFGLGIVLVVIGGIVDPSRHIF